MIITQSTTVLITCGPVQWRGQVVMHHGYIGRGFIGYPKDRNRDIKLVN